VGEFVRFLADVGCRASRVVLIGDLFDLWIGRRTFEQAHHRTVIDALAQLRRDGTEVDYVEGNRDFRVADDYLGEAFDRWSDRGLVETHAGQSLFAIHGDLANPTDRVYRAWRRLARSSLMWWFINLLPRSRRYRFAERLELRLQGANVEFKREFPETHVREYAARYLGQGHSTVVLGHYHVEQDLSARAPSPPGRIVVLPLWRETFRYFRVGADGTAGFERWCG
jgi:UDP-2,3-diacylglucosamine hydrolase